MFQMKTVITQCNVFKRAVLGLVVLGQIYIYITPCTVLSDMLYSYVMLMKLIEII